MILVLKNRNFFGYIGFKAQFNDIPYEVGRQNKKNAGTLLSLLSHSYTQSQKNRISALNQSNQMTQSPRVFLPCRPTTYGKIFRIRVSGFLRLAEK